jgi:hypothetical protein
MKRGVIGLALLLTISFIPAHPATPPKPGSICSKQGITKVYKGKTFKCVKSKNKLVWSKGKLVNQAAPLPTPKPTPTPMPTQSPTSTKPADFSNYKGQLVYGVQGSQLTRRAESGVYYQSDSRQPGTFSEIRERAYAELHKSPGNRNHPNIEFVFQITPSYPEKLIPFIKQELDESAALWSDFFNKKFKVNVYMVTEKDVDYVNSVRWLKMNLPSSFARWENRSERPFVGGGGGFWEADGEWQGNLFFAFPSWINLENINADWPVIVMHEFVHIVQDYAFYRNLTDRPRTLHEVVQPIHFREGSANTISYLTSFKNIGWASDALDGNFWMHTRDSKSHRMIRNEADAISLMKEMECLKTCDKLSSAEPEKISYWTYSYGAIMYEWILATYGLDGYKKMLNQLVTSMTFDQVVQGAFGISKEDLYSKIAPYIVENIRRTKPYDE